MDTAPATTRAAGDPQQPDLHDTMQRRTVEQALRSLTGVHGARLVPGYERPVDEIHVLTEEGRGAKATVRDVQTLLLARFDLPVDHRVVSVAQIDQPRVLGSRPGRVSLEQVRTTRSGMTVEAEVILLDEGVRHVGTASGPASAPGQRRTTGRATLEALRGLLGRDLVVELEGASIERVTGRPIAVGLVHASTDRGSLTLVGGALVEDGEHEAIARAVLDACNRQLESARAPASRG